MDLPSPAERFPRIAEVFENDLPALRDFLVILQRELRQAAGELEAGLAAGDAAIVADLKHKMKTSLRLLEAHELMEAIVTATALLRSGQPVTRERQRMMVTRLQHYADALGSG